MLLFQYFTGPSSVTMTWVGSRSRWTMLAEWLWRENMVYLVLHNIPLYIYPHCSCWSLPVRAPYLTVVVPEVGSLRSQSVRREKNGKNRND